jgi:Zn-dependent metalloprotease
MDNPKADGYSVNCWSSTVGSRDVHYSSGVGNHAFYLLAEGTGTKRIGGRTHSSTTCQNTPMTGIGRNKAVQIWYRALTTYWLSTTGYHGAANGMVQAAVDLYGAGSPECLTTVQAWKGVRVTPSVTCGSAPAALRETP